MPIADFRPLLFWGLVGGLIIVGLLFVSDPAFATGSAGMPWETPMEKIKTSLTGPIAMAISLLGVERGGERRVEGTDTHQRLAYVVDRVKPQVYRVGIEAGADFWLNGAYDTTRHVATWTRRRNQE